MNIFFRRRTRDNRGSTLIEIIVSVLIIGIVFIPLMFSLTTSLKTNTKSKEIMNAETVATNCLEAVKALGKAKIESDYDDTSVTSNFGDSGVITEILAGEKYKIEHMTQGVDASEYSAVVEFSDYDEVIDALPTQEITGGPTPTPRVKPNDRNNYTTLAGLSGMDLVTQVNLSETTGFYSGLATVAYSYSGTSLTEDEVKEKINGKKSVISIEPCDDGNPDHQYLLTCTNYYSFEDGPTGSIFTSLAWYDVEVSKKWFKELPTSLLVLYPAANQNVRQLNSGVTDQVILNKKVDGDMNVFLFIKNVDQELGSDTVTIDSLKYNRDYEHSKMNFTLNVTAPATSGDVTVFSAVPLIKDVGTDDYSKESQMVVTASDTDFLKIWQVKVSVYNSNGELISEKSSTILE